MRQQQVSRAWSKIISLVQTGQSLIIAEGGVASQIFLINLYTAYTKGKRVELLAKKNPY